MTSIARQTAQPCTAHTNTQSQRSAVAHQRVLITGATGFIGSHLTQACVSRGLPVTALVRNAVKARSLPHAVQRRYASLGDPNTIAGAAENIDVVFHLGAAMAGGWRDHQRVTVEGTRLLLEQCRDAGVKRFIHVSSLAAHETSHLADGDTLDAAAPLADDDTPFGNYARGKAQAERLVRDFCAQHGIAFTIVRPGIVYGPGQIIFEHLGSLKGGTFIGFGSRDQRLPMVHIDSLTDALLRIAEAREAEGKTYVIVDEDVPRDQYIQTLGQVSGRAYRQVTLPLVAMTSLAFAFQTARRITKLRKIPDTTVAKVRSRALSLRHDTTALTSDTGWRPNASLRDGLQQALSATALHGQRTVSVGLIGAGCVAHLHLSALRRIAGTQIAGVLDTAPGKAAKLAPQDVPAFDEVEAFYEQARPDVVHVLTPPATHCPVAIDAMQRGVHVLCEKPMACTVEECRRMIDAAKDNGVRLGVSHNYLLDERVNRARTLAEAQAIGDLRHADIFWGFDVRRSRHMNFDNANGNNWMRSLPGGLLEDLAAHPLSIALALLGKDARLVHHHTFEGGTTALRAVTRGSASRATNGGHEELRMMLQSPQRTAHVALSLAVQPDDFAITLYGTRGTLRIDLQDMLLHYGRLLKAPKPIARGLKVATVSAGALVQLAANTLRIAARKGSPPADVQRCLRQFYSSLQNGTPLPATAEDGLHVVQVLREVWPVN